LQRCQFEQNLTEEFVKSEARRLGLASQVAALSNVQATYRQRLISCQAGVKQRELERKLQPNLPILFAAVLQETRIAENQKVTPAVASALILTSLLLS